MVTRMVQGMANLQLGGSLFDRHAPVSKKRINEVISPATIRAGSTYWELPEGLLEPLAGAYREARGVPSEEVEEQPTQRADVTSR